MIVLCLIFVRVLRWLSLTTAGHLAFVRDVCCTTFVTSETRRRDRSVPLLLQPSILLCYGSWQAILRRAPLFFALLLQQLQRQLDFVRRSTWRENVQYEESVYVCYGEVFQHLEAEDIK